MCVQPWDDETDMDEMLKNVKSIEMDGLLWGASKLIPIGYGIKKLQVSYLSFPCLLSKNNLNKFQYLAYF